MSDLPDRVRDALRGMAEEIEASGPVELSPGVVRRVRLRRLRVAGVAVVAISLLAYGGLTGVEVLTHVRGERPAKPPPTHAFPSPNPSPNATGPSPSPPAAATRCTGPGWQLVPMPGPDVEDLLPGIVAISKDDVWAVGVLFNGPQPNPGAQRPLIEHWDGQRWSPIPAPSTGSNNASLYAVAATGPEDVWAVGRLEGSNDPSSQLGALIEHWDGQQWSILPTPDPPGWDPSAGSALTGVAAIAPDDAWAVGSYFVDGKGPTGNGATAARTLAEHWDGRRWSIVPTPDVNNSSFLSSIIAFSPNDVWVGGQSATGYTENGVSDSLIEHWNGRAWSTVATPGGVFPSNSPQASLVALGGRGSTDIWAAAAMGPGGPLLHWNGFVWTLVPRADHVGVVGLTATTPDDVWGVGGGVQHWDGKSWAVVVGLPRLPKGSSITGVAVTPNGDVWAVGGLGYALGSQHPFALRRCRG